MAEDRELKDLADHIRDLWVAVRREFDLRNDGHPSTWGARRMAQWDGGTSKDGHHYKSVWLKIARFCLQNDLMPAMLVHAIFYKRFPPVPNPSEACGSLAIAKYVRYVAPGCQREQEDRLKNEFDSERLRMDTQSAYYAHAFDWDLSDAYKYVLCERCEPLSALFRYCLAMNQGFTKIAETYKYAARAQYMLLPHVYDKVWGEWIPEELKQLGTARNAKEKALVAQK